MGAASAPAAPVDRLLFLLVTFLASLLQAIAASLRSLHRLLRPSPPPPRAFPPHVALAGALARPGDALRVAALARAAGAAAVTVFDPARRAAPPPAPGVRYVRADGARAQALVRAARALASDARKTVPADPAAVLRWLEMPETQRRFGGLESEPDVLLVFADRRGSVRCLAGFPMWQLRLTQICFVETPIEQFTMDDLVAVAGSAHGAPKRFGT